MLSNIQEFYIVNLIHSKTEPVRARKKYRTIQWSQMLSLHQSIIIVSVVVYNWRELNRVFEASPLP